MERVLCFNQTVWTFLANTKAWCLLGMFGSGVSSSIDVWSVCVLVCVHVVTGLDGKGWKGGAHQVVWIPDAGCHFRLCSLVPFQSYKSCNDWAWWRGYLKVASREASARGCLTLRLCCLHDGSQEKGTLPPSEPPPTEALDDQRQAPVTTSFSQTWVISHVNSSSDPVFKQSQLKHM